MILIGGLVLANYGAGVTPAEADRDHDYRHGYQNPFKQILSKLNLILEKLDAGGGGAPSPSPGGAGNHTLRWDTNNASDKRFTTAFTGAVLDNNTGLVWEQAPDATPVTWVGANSHCVSRNVGGTVGWRLPSVVELKSVQDGSPGAVAPFVPASAFTIGGTRGVQSAFYWSATTFAVSPADAWVVDFSVGDVSDGLKTSSGHAWCVRGPMSESAY